MATNLGFAAVELSSAGGLDPAVVLIRLAATVGVMCLVGLPLMWHRLKHARPPAQN